MPSTLFLRKGLLDHFNSSTATTTIIAVILSCQARPGIRTASALVRTGVVIEASRP